ncbi:MAG: DUF5723 family protein [Bacteroidota bacterium]
MQKIVGSLLIFLASLGLYFPKLRAQNPFNLAFSPEQTASQWLQPAHLGPDSSFTWEAGGSYQLGLASQPFGLGLIQSALGTISSEAQANILNRVQAMNELRYQQAYGGSVNYRKQGLKLGLGYRNRIMIGADFADQGLLGLILRGNAAFQDQTVSGQLDFTSLALNEYSGAIAYAQGAWRWGLRAKLFQGQTFSDLSEGDFSIYTAPLGEFLDLAAQYDLFTSQQSGWGWGLDLGATYQPASKVQVQAGLLDLGQFMAPGRIRQADLDLRYEGAMLGDLLQIDTSNVDLLAPADSLLDLYWRDSVAGDRRIAMPGQAYLGASYQWNDQQSTHLAFAYGWSSLGLNGALLFLSHRYAIAPWLKLGLNASVGGVARYGIGALAEGNWRLAGLGIRFFVSADNLTGLFPEAATQGLQLQTGLGILW